MDLLARAVNILDEREYRIINIDVTVICEQPKIGPLSDAMRQRLGDVLGLPLGAVSIKGKTNEGMGWIGRGEGMAVHAVALLASLGELDDQ